jgi:uncharacterized protein YidB (DUF937 family)
MSIFGSLAGAAVSHLSGGKISPEMANMAINLLGLDKEGGIGNLMGQFQKNGLGDVFQSWVGTGENKAITGEQLQSVLPQLSQLANQSGMDLSSISGLAAKFLPELINKATPNGELPAAGQEGDMLHNALQGLLGEQKEGGGLLSSLAGLFGGKS